VTTATSAQHSYANPVGIPELAVQKAAKAAVRKPVIASLMFIPLIISGASLLSGGVALMNDLAMICFTLICIYGVLTEVWNFSFRLGVGALLLYGGCLIWYCYDYYNHWLFIDFNSDIGAEHIAARMETYDANTLARASFYTILFFSVAAWALHIRWKPKFLKIFSLIPEPQSPNQYILIISVLMMIGLVPYIFFTNEPFFVAVYNEMVGGYGGGTAWTVGRTGNTNYNWGGYVAHFITLGYGCGVLAGCLMCVKLPTIHRIILASYWLFWSAIAFGTGARGKLVGVLLPAVIMVFLVNSAAVGAQLRRISSKAYLSVAVFSVVTLLAVQIMAFNRNQGFSNIDFSTVDVGNLKGNEMFTTGLPGYKIIPETNKPLHSTFVGESIVRAIPQTIFFYIIHPIPRALWTSKPIDPAWDWYNQLVTGQSAEENGTTISQSLPGSFFFRYGIFGVIQGGLLFGLIIGGGEQALKLNLRRLFTVIFILAIYSSVFRTFRSMQPLLIVPPLGLLLYLLIATHTARLFSGNAR